jgi:hypothetical protein
MLNREFKQMYTILVKNVEMSDKSAQKKMQDLAVLLEEIKKAKRQRHELKQKIKIEPLPSYCRLESVNPQCKAKANEKMNVKSYLNLPLDFDGLHTSQRVERLSEWMNICHVIQ